MSKQLHLNTPFQQTLFKKVVAIVVLMLVMGVYNIIFTSIAYALPTGWNVVEGNVTIDVTDSIMTITSASDTAIISYISFDLTNGETINFIMPGASSSIINQVIGGNISNIAGSINANGMIGLQNTAGIQIANTAQINAASLLATTLNIANMDANSIDLMKNVGSSGAAIVNEGDINVSNYAILAGSGVANLGNIIAEDGSIHLTVGDKMSFHLSNNTTVDVVIDEGIQDVISDLNVAIYNGGILEAHEVALKAKLADEVIANAINNDGVIIGTGLIDRGGKITINAEGAGTLVTNTGLLYAGATDKSNHAGEIRIRGNKTYNAGGLVAVSGGGQQGGYIEMLGDTVINEGAYIDVSGDLGGGTVLVGGDFQGTGDVERATLNITDNDTYVFADAFTDGDGGKVIFWSDEDTVFSGNIYGRGGVNSGKGGFAEVSGKEFLDFWGFADLTAVDGSKGTLLLDPTNITIQSFTPNDLNPLLWLDASDSSTINTTGSSVNQWNDKSGNGYNATSSGGNRPTLIGAARNGLDVLRFSNDYLDTTLSSNAANLGTGAETFVVGMATADGFAFGSWGAPRFYQGLWTGGYQTGFGNNWNRAGTAAYNQWFYYGMNNNGATTRAYLDGSQLYQYGSSFSGTNGNLLDIGRIAGTGRNWQGDIGEILIYDYSLSTTQRQLVEQYQGAKWNINVSQATLNNYLVPTDSFLVDTYLEALSQSTNINLLADNNITIDNLSDNLLALGNNSLTLTATNGNIVFNDVNDVIRTGNQDITMVAGGNMVLGTLDTQGGANVSLTAGGNIAAEAVVGNTLTVNAGGYFGTSGNHVDTTIATANLTTGTNAYLNETNGITVNASTIGGAFSIANNTAATDIVITNTNATGNTSITSQRNITAQTNNTFGTVTASGNGNVFIYENGDTINVNSVTNASATGLTYLLSYTDDIIGKGTGVADISTASTGLVIAIAGLAAAQVNSNVNINIDSGGDAWAMAAGDDGTTSVRVTGNIGRDLRAEAFRGGFTSTSGDIILGDATDNLSVGRNLNFSNDGTGDAYGIGDIAGVLTGSARRVSFEATSGDLTSNGITASGSTGWAGDETFVLHARSGDIRGAGFNATGAGNMRLQAGSTGDVGTGYSIDVTNINAGQNLNMYATGADGGISIRTGGTTSAAGTMTATGLNASNQFAATTGRVDITATSGDIDTAMVWSGEDIVLTANAGSITQNTAQYGTGYNNSKTLYAADDIVLTAQGAATSHIDTGVQTLSTTGNLTALASGNNGGLSIRTIGRVDGNGVFTHTGGGNTSGEIWLGTTLGGSIANLDDTDQVMDIRGNVTVKSNDDVYMYGGFGLAGSIDVIGRSLTAHTDKWNLNFSRAQTSVTSGTGIDLRAYRGNLLGSTISTAGSANMILQAGNSLPLDKLSNINLSGVTTGGNLNATAYGSTTGNQTGNSIVITGSTGGSTTSTSHINGNIVTP